MKNITRNFLTICPRTGRIVKLEKQDGLLRLLYPIIGLIAIVWILIRIIPKPSRVNYPCMKAATPFASTFLLYIGGWLTSLVFFKKAKKYYRESRIVLFSLSLIAAAGLGLTAYFQTYETGRAEQQSILEEANQPIGVGKGIFPGRVVWIHDTIAVNQSSANDFASLIANTNQQEVNKMLSKAIRVMSGKGTDAEAWDAIFRYHNKTHGRGDVGYTAGEKIAIKINLNNSGMGPAVDTSPEIVFALLDQLVHVAGITQSSIGFGDPGRDVSDIFWTQLHSTFPDVKYWGSTSGRTPIARSSNIEFFSSDGEIENYLPACFVEATYLINIPVFKQHHRSGISLSSKNHFGTLLIFSSTGDAFPYHYSLPCTQGDGNVDNGGYRTYRIFVDFIGHKDLGDKTVLYIFDALWSSTNYGDNAWKWRMAPFNNRYPASIFVSEDPVAIESVGFDFLYNEFPVGNPHGNAFPRYSGVDDFLHQAADSVNWADGIIYHPNGDNVPLPRSMGVHEHWNNATDKQYSRNLGANEGIELIYDKSVTAVNEKQLSSSPDEFIVLQNYPNPFNPSTTIRYRIPSSSHVSLKIYDILGQQMAELVNAKQEAGWNETTWKTNVTSGLYFYRIDAVNMTDPNQRYTQVRKMLLLK